MNEIGGYFELADYEEGIFPHHGGILLNTGRNALEYILRCIGAVQRVYLPYYTCEAVLEPLKKLHMPWSFYHINTSFEIAEEIHPAKGEYIIANNYFGMKDSYIISLAEKYGSHLIVDCAQALFAKPLAGIHSFYSTRKYVGVADGGVAYLGHAADKEVTVQDTDCSDNHNSHLYLRKQYGAEAGFADYQANENKLDNQPIRWMSDATKHMLDHIDYHRIITRRRENYQFLHNALAKNNHLQLPELDSFACPMVYPLLPETGKHLRAELIARKVFVAKYWPNVALASSYETEYQLANEMIPLPCDQRYSINDLERIIEITNNK